MGKRFAESRIGAIIVRVSKSRYTELSVLVAGSLAILAFHGTSAEGQMPLLNSWVRQYVEEKASDLKITKAIAGSQLADMNSFFAGTGGDDSSSSPEPTLESTTVQGNAMIALGPPNMDYIDELTLHRSQVMDYTVQEGDLLSFIASDFGVSTNSIIWANNLKDADSISPGQVLRIPPITGVIHKAKSGDTVAQLAKKYGADEDRILAYNHLPRDGVIEDGTEIIIPDGHPAAGSPQAPTATAIINSKIRRVGTYTQAGSILTALKFNYLPDLGDYFMIPTTGFNWGILHDRNGVDVANSCGTTIYAAADGTVTVADGTGWNGGFGKNIKIAHPNGTETLYGHLSKLLVAQGQSVTRGEKIGLMGTTGRSTGCHLHFEVHGARNPLAKY